LFAVLCVVYISHLFIVHVIRQWLSGPRSGVNPDDVDTEIGAFYRNLYRLEKTFNEIPLAKQMAVDVRFFKLNYLLHRLVADIEFSWSSGCFAHITA